jgi:hypothetical protein
MLLCSGEVAQMRGDGGGSDVSTQGGEGRSRDERSGSDGARDGRERQLQGEDEAEERFRGQESEDCSVDVGPDFLNQFYRSLKLIWTVYLS